LRLAIFDLDNTLIAGDSDHSWGQFLVEKKLVDGEHFRRANDRFYEEYKAGTLNIVEYLQFSLTPLTHHTMEKLAELHQEFMRNYIQPMMLHKANELLAWHRAQGDYLLIITATNGFVTRPIATALGVDDILTTDPEIVNGRYTGKFVGIPTFQKGKVIRLQDWLNEKQFTLDDAYFYSDSINDLPLLEQVPNPIVVDPDAKLQTVAETRNWKIISLR
jgi:HAD superfamily hydrolase (TIGR01490 family)